MADGWRTQDGRQLTLTERQHQILLLLSQGRTNAEIARELDMTLDGAKWHVSEIIAKLGVRNREEAAAWWRRERRPVARLRGKVQGARGLGWLAWGAGAAAVVAAVAIAAALVIDRDRDGSPAAPAPATSTTAPSSTAVATPTSVPLTAEEILHRSEQAMAALPIVRVESVSWPTTRTDVGPQLNVYEYAGATMRWLYASEFERTDCSASDLQAPPYSERSLGALAVYKEPRYQDRGASEPETFEFLGEDTLDGREVWIIRYAFSYPSIEGAIPVEDTEWIAKDSYVLLRQERDYRDAFGFIGQSVSVIWPVDTPAADCPATPEHTVEELRPLTSPRLSKPPE